MSKVSVVLVEDEKKARAGLEKLVFENPRLKLKGVCKDGIEALDTIDKIKPDLLLLDIQMPGISGFDVLKSIRYRPVVIFITAYDTYALRAFDHHALDYILKPFTDDRFDQAIQKAIEIIEGQQAQQSLEKLAALIDQLSKEKTSNETIPSTQQSDRFIIRANGQIRLISFDAIFWFEAFDYYVKVHETETHVIKDSLKNLELVLPDHFVRVHKSAIINLHQLESLEPLSHSDFIAKLAGGREVKVSRSYKDALLKRL